MGSDGIDRLSDGDADGVVSFRVAVAVAIAVVVVVVRFGALDTEESDDDRSLCGACGNTLRRDSDCNCDWSPYVFDVGVRQSIPQNPVGDFMLGSIGAGLGIEVGVDGGGVIEASTTRDVGFDIKLRGRRDWVSRTLRVLALNASVVGCSLETASLL